MNNASQQPGSLDFPTPEYTPLVIPPANWVGVPSPKVIRGDRADERCELCKHLLSQHIAAVGCTARDCGCVKEPK